MASTKQKSVPIFNDSVQIEVRNRVLSNQGEEISKNERLIENADADLATVRRQVEIIEDSSLRKANHLFLLKTVLTMIGILFILVLLLREKVISEVYGTYGLYAIGLIFLYIIYKNLSSAYSRNNNRFSLRNFLTKAEQIDGKPMLPKRTCLAKPKVKKTPEELELERKLNILRSLENKFDRVRPNIDMINSRADNVNKKIDEIKAEYRDVFGDTSDKAIEIAIQNHLDNKGKTLLSLGI